MERVLHQVEDTRPSKRWIIIVARLANHATVLLCSFYLQVKATVEDRRTLIDDIKENIIELKNNYKPDHTFCCGDTNITLDDPEREPSLYSHFQGFLHATDLIDSFRSIYPDMRTHAGHTYIPTTRNRSKPSRLDYILTDDTAILPPSTPEIKLLTYDITGSDHLGLNLSLTSYTLDKCDRDALRLESWRFQDWLLLDDQYTTAMKHLLQVTAASKSHYNSENGGCLTTNEILRNTPPSDIDSLFNHADEEYDWIQLIYDLIDTIKQHQIKYLDSKNGPRIKLRSMLRNELATLMNIFEPSRADTSRTHEIKEILNAMEEEDTARRAYNAGLDYHTLGDQPTKYFLRRMRRRGNLDITSLEIDGEETADIQSIERHLYEEYTKVFSTEDKYEEGDLETFLGNQLFRIGKISTDTRTQLEHTISASEVIAATSRLNDGKAGGLDGLTSRATKVLVNLLPNTITAAIKYQIIKGNHAHSRLVTKNVVLINKPNTEHRTRKKLRPIALYNSLLKVTTNIIHARLKAALNLHHLLPSYLNAYKQECGITDILMSVLSLISNAKNFEKPICIVVADLDSAFDSASRNLARAVLTHMNFPPEFIDTIFMMENNARISITIPNRLPNEKPEPIPQNSGYSQGNPLSGELFSICSLPLLIKLNFSPLVRAYIPMLNQSTPMDNTNIHASQAYSDDVLTALDNHSPDSINEVIKIYRDFENISSLKINVSKTTLAFPNGLPPDHTIDELIRHGFNVSKIGTSFKFLGFVINGPDIHLGVTNMIKAKNKKIERTIAAYNSSRSITAKGRAIIASSLLESQFPHFITCAADLRKKSFEPTQKLITSFVTKKAIMKRDQAMLPRTKGGMSVPCLHSRYITAKVALARKAIMQSNRWDSDPSTPRHTWFHLMEQTCRAVHIRRISHLTWAGLADLSVATRSLRNTGFPLLASIWECVSQAILITNVDGFTPGSGLCIGIPRALVPTARIGARPDGPRTRSKTVRRDRAPSRPSTDDPTSPDPTRTTARSYNSTTPNPNPNQDGSTPKPPTQFWPNHPILGSPMHPSLRHIHYATQSQLLRPPEPNTPSIRNPATQPLLDGNLRTIGQLLHPHNKHPITPSLNMAPHYAQSHPSTFVKIFKQAQAQALEVLIQAKHVLKIPTDSEGKFHFDTIRCALNKNSGKFNSKSVYNRIVGSLYGRETFSGVDKLRKRGLPEINQTKILNGLKRASSGITTARMNRAAMEVATGSVRTELALAEIDNRNPRPCHVCQLPENISSWQHIFLDCATAKYCWDLAYSAIILVTGKRVAITNDLITFSALKPREFKYLNKQQRRDTLAIIANVRETIYNLYYRRPHDLSGDLIEMTIRKNLHAQKRIALTRKTKSSIALIPNYLPRTGPRFEVLRDETKALTLSMTSLDNSPTSREEQVQELVDHTSSDSTPNDIGYINFEGFSSDNRMSAAIDQCSASDPPDPHPLNSGIPNLPGILLPRPPCVQTSQLLLPEPGGSPRPGRRLTRRGQS